MAEGPVNLNWDPIMKHINESPLSFSKGVGPSCAALPKEWRAKHHATDLPTEW
ncbi:hypothetical protein BDP27DRAFT_1431326 [Rhodocollybia butyracea]|uniref:Uncharacterized protein n=1 Tax=Rhodocollybia butyracea TaxID=206335 RepID=A0A9P5P737_9AGAR|nr:hypothetical protein BDP27DRAFT_1431326 [Rhodocollybia butyracea]